MAALDNLKLYKLAKTAMEGLLPILRSNAVMPNLMKNIPNNTSVPLQGPISDSDVTNRTVGNAMTTVANPEETAANFRITKEAEYVMPLDVLNRINMKPFDYLMFNMDSIQAAIADKIDKECLALYTSIPTTHGNSTTPAISDLAQVKKKMKDNKVSFADRSKIHCVVGTEEEAAWITSSNWQNEGPASQRSIMDGALDYRYGFNIWVDQNRPTSGDTAYNLCFQEGFAGITYTQTYDVHKSITQVSVTDKVSGLTIFVQDWPMNEGTYGVGQKYRFVVPFHTGIIDANRACRLLGGVSE